MQTKTKYPVMPIILMCMLMCIIVIFILQMVKDSLNLYFGLYCIFAAVYSYITQFDLEIRALRKAKNFIAMDGTVSICETNLEPTYGNRYKITIATKADNVPKDDWHRMNNWQGFAAWISNRVHYEIEGQEDDFIPIEGKYSGTKEGSILYLGGLAKGRPVMSLDTHLREELRLAKTTLSKVHDLIETAKSQSAADSREGNQRIVENINKMMPVIKNILDSSRPYSPGTTQNTQQR